VGREVVKDSIARPLRLLEYLVLTTETHALCGSLAFFAMLGFYPLSVLLVSLARFVWQSPSAHDTVRLALETYYPAGQDFLLRNLEVSSGHLGEDLSVYSALWIFLGGAGIFIPLETAFNRLWGFSVHRPYWRNQALGFVLTLACWVLVVGFVLAGAALPMPWREWALRPAAVVVAAAVLFLFYRFLPNGRVPIRAVLPAAAAAAIVAELVRYAFAWLLPALNLPRSQGPFHVSISFLVLVYLETFVVLGGAYLAAEASGVVRPATSDTRSNSGSGPSD
jgi:uncharacterized BrkB/YihY/UPF0761 family membrane protein